MGCTILLILLTVNSLVISKSAAKDPSENDASKTGQSDDDNKAQGDTKLTEMECPSKDLTSAIVKLVDTALKSKASSPARELKLSFTPVNGDILVTRCDDNHRLHSLEIKGTVAVTAEGVYTGICTAEHVSRYNRGRPTSWYSTFADKNRFKFTFPLRASFTFANKIVVMPEPDDMQVKEMTVYQQDNNDSDYVCKTDGNLWKGYEMKEAIGSQAMYACNDALIDALLKRETPCNDEAKAMKNDIFGKLHGELSGLQFKFMLHNGDRNKYQAKFVGEDFNVDDLETPCNRYNRFEYIRLNKRIKISVTGGDKSTCDGTKYLTDRRKKRSFGFDFTTTLGLNRSYSTKASPSGQFQRGNWFSAWDYQLTGELAQVPKCKRGKWIVSMAGNIISKLTSLLEESCLEFLMNY